MPKKITAKGTQAVIGMGRRIWMIGSTRSDTRRNQPIRQPIRTPVRGGEQEADKHAVRAVAGVQ